MLRPSRRGICHKAVTSPTRAPVQPMYTYTTCRLWSELPEGALAAVVMLRKEVVYLWSWAHLDRLPCLSALWGWSYTLQCPPSI